MAPEFRMALTRKTTGLVRMINLLFEICPTSHVRSLWGKSSTLEIGVVSQCDGRRNLRKTGSPRTEWLWWIMESTPGLHRVIYTGPRASLLRRKVCGQSLPTRLQKPARGQRLPPHEARNGRLREKAASVQSRPTGGLITPRVQKQLKGKRCKAGNEMRICQCR